MIVLKLSMPINMKLNIMSCSLAVFVIYTEIQFVYFMNSHRILELGKILGNIWFSIHSSHKQQFLLRLTGQNYTRPGTGCILCIPRGRHLLGGLCNGTKCDAIICNTLVPGDQKGKTIQIYETSQSREGKYTDK